MFFNWLNWLNRKSTPLTARRRATARRRPSSRLWLEALEDRLQPSGLTLLGQQFSGGSGNEIGTGIAVVDAGTNFSVYTSGHAESTDGGEGLLSKYSVPHSLGAPLPVWNQSWPGAAGEDSFDGVAATPTAVYAAGYSDSQTTDIVGGKEHKGIIASFSAAGGTSTWVRQAPGTPGAFPYGGIEGLNAVTVTTEAGQLVLYATGYAQDTGNSRLLYVSKLDAAGNVLWTQTDPAGSSPDSNGLAIAASGGNVYVAGRKNGSGTTQTYLKKYDPTGTLLWSHTSTLGVFNGLTVDAGTGSLYSVGQTSGPNANFLVEKWDAAGSRVWSQTYDRSGADDILNGVTLLNGRLYAAGSTRGGTAGGSDGVVLEIDPATGTLLATTLWGGAADDSFQGIVATPAAIHIVGTTNSFGSGGSDVAYVLYSALSNRPPVLDAIGDKTVDVGSTLSFAAHGTDPDGDGLIYSLDPGAPAGAGIDPSTGLFTFTPAVGPATYTVTVRVGDGALTATATVTINVVGVAPPPGLVAWLPGNGNANDIVAQTSGTLGTGVTFGEGMVGQAFSFLQPFSKVSIPDNHSLNFERDQPFSIAAWVKTSDPAGAAPDSAVSIFEKGIFHTGASPAYGMALRPGLGNIDIYLQGVNNTNRIFWRGPVGVDVSGWHHYAMSYDGSSQVGGIHVYVDGNEIFPTLTESTLTTSIQNSTTAAFGNGNFQGDPANQFIPSSLDEVQVFNRVVSQGEFQAVFQAPGIVKVDATIVVSPYAGMYDGVAHGLTVTATGVGGVDLSGLLSLGVAQTDAGTYATAWSFAGNANYNAASGMAPIQIDKATSTTGVIGDAFTYDGSTHTGGSAMVSGDGVVTGNAVLSYTGDQIDAGTYTVIGTYAGDANHTGSSGSATISTDKASSTTTVTGATFTYDGSSHTGGSAMVSGDGVVTGNAVLSYTGDQIDAGTYTVIGTYAGDANHTGNSDSATITIDKASSTTTVTGATFTYDGSTHTGGSAVVSGDGVVTGNAVLSYTGDQIDAGTYTVIGTYAGDANHTGSSASAIITIAKANTTTTLTSSTGGNSYYGQSVTFTATVAAQLPSGGTPAGTVQFLNNGQILFTASLANGKATWTTSALGVGVNSITVKYLGSSNDVASTTLAPLAQMANVGILLLDATGKGALTVNGNGKVIVDGNSIVVDSSNAAAIVVIGNGSVQAALTDIVGGDTTSGHGQIVGTVQTGQGYVNDPLANLAAPNPSALTVQSHAALSISGNQVVTLNPGLYIGGISISGNAKVTLNPGVYYLQGGGFTVSGNASVTDLGKGVMIYNAPTKSRDSMSFSGNGTVQLSAMTSGPWAGITLFQDRTSAAALSVTGNGNLDVTGTIYAAGATLNITGNGGVDDHGTPLDTFGTSLIVDDLVVSGNGNLVV